jgi:hypothetical protein
MVFFTRRQCLEKIRHRDSRGSDPPRAAPTQLVGCNSWARRRQRAAHRIVVCRAPGIDADGEGVGGDSRCTDFALGDAGRARECEWIARRIPSAAGDVHAVGHRRLPSRAGLARITGRPGDAARLSQGSRAPDAVGHSAARQGTVLADHGGCNCVPGVSAQSNPA